MLDFIQKWYHQQLYDKLFWMKIVVLLYITYQRP